MPTHVPKNILPALKRAGAAKAKFRAMRVENRRRYFQSWLASASIFVQPVGYPATSDSVRVACGKRSARLDGSAPFVDCLDGKTPVAADAERGKLVFFQHPVNRGRMHPEVA